MIAHMMAVSLSNCHCIEIEFCDCGGAKRARWGWRTSEQVAREGSCPPALSCLFIHLFFFATASAAAVMGCDTSRIGVANDGGLRLSLPIQAGSQAGGRAGSDK